MFKTEFTRSSSNKWTKTLYQDYLHCIANFTMTVLNIFSTKKSFLATPNVENKFWTSHESLESTGVMKLMMKFYLCLHNFSELWNLFSLIPKGNWFQCYFRQVFISLALRKCKKDCKILKIILVPDFCPLRTEIAWFSIGFHLKISWLAMRKTVNFIG